MNTSKKIKNFVLIGTIILISGILITWLQRSYFLKQVGAQNKTQLKLELSTSQNKFVQLEPIPFNLRLSNQTTIPIKWNGLLEIGNDISFVARAEDGTITSWNGSGHGADIIMDTEAMQPGENKTVQSLIDDSLAERLFSRPGRYQLQVEFRYLDYSFGQTQAQTIKSNPITIDVKEPVGNDRRAYDYLKNTYKPIRQRGNVEDRIRAQQYFVDNFQHSVYWKYITHNLAVAYSFRNENETAEREFFKLVDVEFYHSKDVKKQLGHLAKKLGRPTALSNHPPGAPLQNLPLDAPVLRGIPPIPVTTNPPGSPPVLTPIATPTP